jgi:hypothetical protein
MLPQHDADNLVIYADRCAWMEAICERLEPLPDLES